MFNIEFVHDKLKITNKGKTKIYIGTPDQFVPEIAQRAGVLLQPGETFEAAVTRVVIIDETEVKNK